MYVSYSEDSFSSACSSSNDSDSDSESDSDSGSSSSSSSDDESSSCSSSSDSSDSDDAAQEQTYRQIQPQMIIVEAFPRFDTLSTSARAQYMSIQSRMLNFDMYWAQCRSLGQYTGIWPYLGVGARSRHRFAGQLETIYEIDEVRVMMV